MWCVPVGLIFGLAAGFKSGHPILGLLAGPLLMSALGLGIRHVMSTMPGDFIGHAVVPDTRGGTGVPYSHIEALEAKGDIVGALAAWEAAVAASPDAIAARINCADLHARRGNNPARAAQLFREVQTHSNAPEENQRYAAQRLIDLYLGALNDEGRALVELRKIADRWPGTPEARGALTAIGRIKAGRAK